jgi:hypothetical protein
VQGPRALVTRRLLHSGSIVQRVRCRVLGRRTGVACKQNFGTDRFVEPERTCYGGITHCWISAVVGESSHQTQWRGSFFADPRGRNNQVPSDMSEGHSATVEEAKQHRVETVFMIGALALVVPTAVPFKDGPSRSRSPLSWVEGISNASLRLS